MKSENSILARYVSDPRNDGTYVLNLDEKSTRELWDEIDWLHKSWVWGIAMQSNAATDARRQQKANRIKKRKLRALRAEVRKLKSARVTVAVTGGGLLP